MEKRKHVLELERRDLSAFHNVVVSSVFGEPLVLPTLDFERVLENKSLILDLKTFYFKVKTFEFSRQKNTSE